MTRRFALAFLLAAVPVAAQHADSVRTETLAPGVAHMRLMRDDGSAPFIMKRSR